MSNSISSPPLLEMDVWFWSYKKRALWLHFKWLHLSAGYCLQSNTKNILFTGIQVGIQAFLKCKQKSIDFVTFLQKYLGKQQNHVTSYDQLCPEVCLMASFFWGGVVFVVVFSLSRGLSAFHILCYQPEFPQSHTIFSSTQLLLVTLTYTTTSELYSRSYRYSSF